VGRIMQRCQDENHFPPKMTRILYFWTNFRHLRIFFSFCFPLDQSDNIIGKIQKFLFWKTSRDNVPILERDSMKPSSHSGHNMASWFSQFFSSNEVPPDTSTIAHC
jgi:hypothetical protein